MRPPKITTLWLLVLIAALGLILGGIRLLHDEYYEERIRAMTQLERVDGIKDIEIIGFDDITYEVVSARFQIAGRPEAVIVMQEP